MCLRFELAVIRSKSNMPASVGGGAPIVTRDIFGGILQIDKQLGG